MRDKWKDAINKELQNLYEINVIWKTKIFQNTLNHSMLNGFYF